jgi:hypothetical protein
MNKILQDKYENQTKITDVKPLEQIWLGERDGNITFEDSLDFDISEIESVYEASEEDA